MSFTKKVIIGYTLVSFSNFTSQNKDLLRMLCSQLGRYYNYTVRCVVYVENIFSKIL